jgi:hypothetical protein
MSRLLNTSSNAEVAIAAAVASLPAVPDSTSIMVVPSDWLDSSNRVVDTFDLDMWADATITLTSGILYAGRLHAKAIAATAIDSTTHATDTFNEAAHGLLTGDGPFQLTTSGTVPAGLALLHDYWVIKTGAGTFKLADSLALALAGTPVTFSSDGTGVHTITGASAKRVHWHSNGALPTPISLTNQLASTRRCKHRPGVVAYAVAGTLSAGNFRSAITPVMGA